MTNLKIAQIFVEKYREHRAGNPPSPVFTPEHSQIIFSGIQKDPIHMADFLGDVATHVWKIMFDANEEPKIIYDCLLNCNKVLVGLVMTYIITLTRPDLKEGIMAGMEVVKEEKEIVWADVTKNLDFEMSSLGKQQLDS